MSERLKGFLRGLCAIINLDICGIGRKVISMNGEKNRRIVKDMLVFTGILAVAVTLSAALSGRHDDNNPFAAPLFILAVALIARLTDGYFYGIAASLAGTFCVNYMFTYPFWQFDVSLTGYPLTFVMMLVVSVIISALTTQIKRQERLRFDADREKMRANLLRAIAHDIRTPLTSILGSSAVLKERDIPEGDREALLDGIHRDAQWLVRVTENLLSVTRFSGGDVSLKKEDEALEEIVGSAINKYRRGPDALPVQPDCPERLLIVPMDATLIEQVLINLFDNVSAHARGATRIWLHIRSETGRVVLSVEDDGEGIAPALLPTLFDGGAHQVRQGSADGRRSMGIGLSVCRTIIRAHGGEMSAGRSAHGGAAFSFYLPCGEEDDVQRDSQ